MQLPSRRGSGHPGSSPVARPRGELRLTVFPPGREIRGKQASGIRREPEPLRCWAVVVRVVLLDLTRKIQLCVSFSEHPNVDSDELADAKPGIVHQSDDCIIALLKILRTLLVARVPQGVDLVRFEPDFRSNFGICI